METQRLLLRSFADDDWADLYEYLSDEEVVRYEPYPPLTEAQCREECERRAASDAFWAVCLRDGGKLIGNVYLAEGEQLNWEVGYVFNRHYQNKGYATEAVTALINVLFTEHRAHRVYAQCNPDNAGSWKLLKRIGFRREAHLKKNCYFHLDGDGAPIWQDTYIYGILQEEW